MKNAFTDEAQYRAVMKQTLDRVEASFDGVDPDVAECSVQFGALTIAFPGGRRIILSAQPSVSQLWMAVAAKGVAYHFDFEPATKRWLDDKQTGKELFSLLSQLVSEEAKQEIRIP